MSILTGRLSHKRWGYTQIVEACAKLYNDGYEMHRWQDGSLGDGCYVMIPPDPERMYCFVIEEHYGNEWISYHTVNRRRISKIPPVVWELIDLYENHYAGVC